MYPVDLNSPNKQQEDTPLWVKNIKILNWKVKKKRDYILDKHKIAWDKNPARAFLVSRRRTRAHFLFWGIIDLSIQVPQALAFPPRVCGMRFQISGATLPRQSHCWLREQGISQLNSCEKGLDSASPEGKGRVGPLGPTVLYPLKLFHFT